MNSYFAFTFLELPKFKKILINPPMRHGWNEEELPSYDQAEKYEATYIACMDQKFDEGEKKGRAEGEKSALLKVAKNMVQQGLSSKDVQKITGLSQQEMSSIQQ